MVDLAAPLPFSRRLAHLIEAAAAGLLIALFRILPLDHASALGGALARTIGPRLGVSRQADQNLRRVFPDWSETTITGAIRDMWDNAGRTVAEYPNLHRIQCYAAEGRVKVIGAEHIDRLRDDGRAGIFFSGHLANWEIMPLAVAQRGVDISLVYRAANNPWIDRMILQARGAITQMHVPKGAAGARKMIEIIKAGGHLGMLVDQKHNAGIAVPFFGYEAMTAPAIAQLALKFDLPLVPCAVERTGGAHFRVTIHPPLPLPRSGDRAADVQALMVTINRCIEDFVRVRPAHWMWLHRRWRDS